MEEDFKDVGVWVTWERQTRNKSASNYLGTKLVEIAYPSRSRILRYIRCISKTITIIVRERPKFLFAQNPSVVLGLLSVLIRRISSIRVIIDAHNSGIFGPEESYRFIQKFNNFILKNANAVIVTNSGLANYVKSQGGNPIILPDPLPHLTLPNVSATLAKKKRLKAFCITSWSEDEPAREILTASSRFRDSVDFYFSGNYQKAFKNSIPPLHANAHLIGFVDENTFLEHLFSSDFCIDLTRRSDCMVCGAYESIAAEKPVLLSDSAALREYFYQGSVFCDNTTEGIANSILTITNRIDELKQDASQLKAKILKKEAQQKPLIIRKIKSL